MVLRLKSSSTCISEVEQYVRKLFEQYGIDPELYPNILISLTEAVNNAIQHGNRNDITKVVCVRSKKNNQVLCCEISDEGPGFDPASLPDPTDPENIEKPGGRGVFLMRQLSDSIRFKDNGSTVELEFYL
ncbi:MAG TPA: ATP-binding protein [Saprospiraceae bacterium]|nr:ATP-binding protein [Saprospiraceae bacterium]